VSVPHPAPDVSYPVLGRDVFALIGIVAILEADSMLATLPKGLERGLAERLVSDGLLPESATSTAALRVGLSTLAQRLHAAYGAHPGGPPQLPLP
jgi:hypothetical protein